MKTQEQANPTELQATIKLGIDAHAKWFYVARQVEGATPQPVQKLTLDGLLCFVARQQRLAREVYTGYVSSGARETACKAARRAGAGAPVNPGLSATTCTGS